MESPAAQGLTKFCETPAHITGCCAMLPKGFIAVSILRLEFPCRDLQFNDAFKRLVDDGFDSLYCYEDSLQASVHDFSIRDDFFNGFCN